MRTKIVFILLILGGIILGNHLSTNALDIQKKVTGTVTDTTGKPLSDVTIMIKGREVGTRTNTKGTYVLFVTNADTLVFSKKEMKTQEVSVGQKTQIDIVLQKAKNETYQETFRRGNCMFISFSAGNMNLQTIIPFIPRE